MSPAGVGCGAIVIADEDRAVLSLLTRLFEAEDLAVVAVETGEEALAVAQLQRPGAAVLEVELPGISGYEVCRALRKRFGDELPIMFISGVRTESFDRVAGLLLGADDYMAKPFAPGELLARVQGLLRRSASHRPEARSDLSQRELEVLRLLVDGLKPSEIADRLVISPKTVGSHIEHIFDKLGVHSRAEAVALAYRQDLVRTAG